MEHTHKPELEIRSGAVQATAWRNEGEYGPYYTVTITRLYRDPHRRWHRLSTFRPQDLPAYRNVVAQMQEELSSLSCGIETEPAAINASIWKHDGPYGVYYTGAIGRFYKDKDGRRRLAKGFRVQDLPVVSDLVADLANKFTVLADNPSQLLQPKTTPISDIGIAA